jgi:hypothetical protein
MRLRQRYGAKGGVPALLFASHPRLAHGFICAHLRDLRANAFPNGEVYGADSLKCWASRNWFGVVGSGNFCVIPTSVQDGAEARRISGLWLGVREAHIQGDTQQARNDARGPKDKRTSLSLNVNWNQSQLWSEDFTAKLSCNVEYWLACPP